MKNALFDFDDSDSFYNLIVTIYKMGDLRVKCFSRFDLNGAVFNIFDMSGADLNHIDFTKANLYGCTFQAASMEDAILREADLIRCGFNKADLTSADLYKADISESDFSGALLSEAQNFEQAKNHKNARWTECSLSKAQSKFLISLGLKRCWTVKETEIYEANIVNNVKIGTITGGTVNFNMRVSDG